MLLLLHAILEATVTDLCPLPGRRGTCIASIPPILCLGRRSSPNATFKELAHKNLMPSDDLNPEATIQY
jgi:hypothetical protein